jgi:hypothetical protein
MELLKIIKVRRVGDGLILITYRRLNAYFSDGAFRSGGYVRSTSTSALMMVCGSHLCPLGYQILSRTWPGGPAWPLLIGVP